MKKSESNSNLTGLSDNAANILQNAFGNALAPEFEKLSGDLKEGIKHKLESGLEELEDQCKSLGKSQQTMKAEIKRFKTELVSAQKAQGAVILFSVEEKINLMGGRLDEIELAISDHVSKQESQAKQVLRYLVIGWIVSAVIQISLLLWIAFGALP